MRVKVLVILLLLVGIPGSYAHNAKITTCNLRLHGDTWWMEIAFAQASLDAVISKKIDQEILDVWTDQELKQWLVNYVRDNVVIESEGQSIGLGAGGFQLGSHQSDFRFSLPELSLFPEKVDFTISFCNENDGHTNILRIFQGDQMSKFFLDHDNGFQVKTQFASNKVIAMDVEKTFKFWWAILILLGIVVAVWAIPKFSALRN